MNEPTHDEREAARLFARMGGKAGTGKSKRRTSSFTSATAKAAVQKRWTRKRLSK